MQRKKQSEETNHSYTNEQVELIDRILRQPDDSFYNILGLEQFSSVEEVKKAYKQLSLQVHPDKNKAPRATEAFKVVNKAYNVLNDSEQKNKYDTEKRQQNQRQQNQRTRFQNENTNYGHDDSYKPPQYSFYHPQRRYWFKMEKDLKVFLLMFGIPILIMVLYPVLCYLFETEEPFALRNRGPFTQRRLTSIGRIPYYVKEGFQFKDLKQFHELEDRVEKKYYQFFAKKM